MLAGEGRMVLWFEVEYTQSCLIHPRHNAPGTQATTPTASLIRRLDQRPALPQGRRARGRDPARAPTTARVRPEGALHRGVLRNEEGGGGELVREKREFQRAKFKVMPRVRPEGAFHQGAFATKKVVLVSL